MEHSVIGVLQRVTEVLERLGIDHVVGGSLASSALGIPRSTNDADLVADLRTEHVEALVSALEDEFYADAGMIAEAIDHLGSFNLIHYTTAQKVDVFVSGTDDFRRAQIRRARQRELAGATLPFTSAEDTILAPEYMVVIAGVPEAGYNGTFMVDEVISPTQFTYTTPTNGLADSTGGTVALPPQPNLAQTWDDWPPYYGQSYSALLGGPDGSTVEMTNAHGRLVAKQAQYIAFYSSNNFWVDHKAAMLRDHVGTFVRGVTAALPNPSAFDDDPSALEPLLHRQVAELRKALPARLHHSARGATA